MPSGPIGRHLSALGRFGETAFISPLYGVGELSQSFCRMAAVHGAVYVLRRQLKGAVVDRVTKRWVAQIWKDRRERARGRGKKGRRARGVKFCMLPGRFYGREKVPKKIESE